MSPLSSAPTGSDAPAPRKVGFDPSRFRPAKPAGDDDSPSAPQAQKAKAAFVFRADLDLAELDGRGRPGPSWPGRAFEISRSHLSMRSRRMCYEGRELVIAVHLIDDKPTPLFGIVAKSEYDGDGLYRTTLNLQRLPESDAMETWVESLVHKPRDSQTPR